MAPYLIERGYKVACYGTAYLPEGKVELFTSPQEALAESACVVCGIPFLKQGAVYMERELPSVTEEEFFHSLREGQKVFAGVIGGKFREQCASKSVACYDFTDDHSYAIFNAIATAEGAILNALQHQNTNIHGSQCLVLGYGRCGKVLVDKLEGLKANITVCSRNQEELAYASAYGTDTFFLEELPQRVAGYEYIFNTIPAVVITKEILLHMRKDSLIIDIASGKGGVEYDAAWGLSIAAKHCLGLPGKYAPKVSAQALVEIMQKHLE